MYVATTAKLRQPFERVRGTLVELAYLVTVEALVFDLKGGSNQ